MYIIMFIDLAPINNPIMTSEGTTVPVFPNIAQMSVTSDLPVCNRKTKPGNSNTDLEITANIHAKVNEAVRLKRQ